MKDLSPGVGLRLHIPYPSLLSLVNWNKFLDFSELHSPLLQDGNPNDSKGHRIKKASMR